MLKGLNQHRLAENTCIGMLQSWARPLRNSETWHWKEESSKVHRDHFRSSRKCLAFFSSYLWLLPLMGKKPSDHRDDSKDQSILVNQKFRIQNFFLRSSNSCSSSSACPTSVRLVVNPRARAKWLHFMARNVCQKRKGPNFAPPANDTLKLRKGSRDFKAKRSECLKDAQTASMCVNLLSSSWKLEGCWRLSQVAQLPESDLPQVRLPQYKVAAELPTESDRRASALQLMNGFSMKPKTYVIEIKATTQSSRVKRLRQNIHVQPDLSECTPPNPFWHLYSKI